MLITTVADTNVYQDSKCKLHSQAVWIMNTIQAVELLNLNGIQELEYDKKNQKL